MTAASKFPLFLYDTLRRKKVEFVPIAPDAKVSMYTCGPTVYSDAHIGNFRTYVFEDVLKRTLEYNGFKVKHVMNITDVGHLTDDADRGEDKVEKSASREGKTAWEIAAKYTAIFQSDMRDLNIEEPDVWCKATDHIEEQIALVQRLEEKGVAYRIEDGIYYDTSKFERYGELARLKIESLDPGKRVKVAEGKRNPTDFALWKFSPPNQKRQMEWDSPWGRGFPGWHIECSAMSMRYLGERFDIHCGGIDHIPVHHTNEIAQVEAVTGKKWVNYWLHGEFLLIGKEEAEAEEEAGTKMAKSEGNVLTIRSLVGQGYHPLAYRYFLLNAHYRKQLLFRDDVMRSAQSGFENFRARVADLKGGATGEDTSKYREAFVRAMNDDLNAPQALAVAWEVLHDKKLLPGDALNLIEDFDRILGLNATETPVEAIPPEVREQIERRRQARAEKNWQLADEIRNELRQEGYEILDTKDGARLKFLPGRR